MMVLNRQFLLNYQGSNAVFTAKIQFIMKNVDVQINKKQESTHFGGSR